MSPDSSQAAPAVSDRMARRQRVRAWFAGSPCRYEFIDGADGLAIGSGMRRPRFCVVWALGADWPGSCAGFGR